MNVAIETRLAVSFGNDTSFFYEGDAVRIFKVSGDYITGKITRIDRDCVTVLIGVKQPRTTTVYVRNIKNIQRFER